MSETTSTPPQSEKSFGRDVAEQSTLALATTAAAVVGLLGAGVAVEHFSEWRENRRDKKIAKKAQTA